MSGTDLPASKIAMVWVYICTYSKKEKKPCGCISSFGGFGEKWGGGGVGRAVCGCGCLCGWVDWCVCDVLCFWSVEEGEGMGWVGGVSFGRF